ncbi:MAG: protein phosphatase 2C domain-containing protein [Pyrinomonadaceae bacterium]
MGNNSLRITSGSVSDRGLSEKRPENEDSFLELGASGIFAVADGVGGAQAGEVASQMAVEILGEAFNNIGVGSDAETVMRTAFERANAAIFHMAQDLPQLSNMATTVVALHLAENIATIGHVGDSRLYRVDADGELHRETADHSVVAEEVRSGRMTEEQAATHPSRNIISRALGAEATVEADFRTILVEPGSAFLICSDGITRHVEDGEIKGVLNFGGSPADICDYLKRLCFERGAEDNLTAVVVKVAQSDASKEVSVGSSSVEQAVASVREPLMTQPDKQSDDSVLELDTKPLTLPSDSSLGPIVPVLPISGPGGSQKSVPAIETAEPERVTTQAADFEMFGEKITGDRPASVEIRPAGWALPAVVSLVIGSLIGLGAYHYLLRPEISTVQNPALSEMRSSNIPLNAFEDNRRNVDADPAAYALRVGPIAQDAEDFYLLGRAFLLTGKYPEARSAFLEARELLPEADPVNAKVLASDIALGLAVITDTTIRSILETELRGATARPMSSNSNR